MSSPRDYITFETDDEIYFPGFNALYDFHITRTPRRIAGSKRVARYQSRQGYKASGHILQSITAHPALSTRSFEELRLECYAQSVVAQGRPPACVDAAITSAEVIPPLFNAYVDETDDILPNEITMAD